MKIGLDGSRAFLKNRTGIEEYSYQVIKHLRDKLEGHQVVLYLRSDQQIDFDLPENWNVKIINFPRLWTQLGLSLEMLFSPVDALFIPAHTVPIIHPKNTIVTIHGLEYEFCKNAYSSWESLYMRWTIKKSCQWAKKIISVSNNTKTDLIKLYSVKEDKIQVVYEGYENHATYSMKNESKIQKPYLLFVGRIEERKNISNTIKAFEILKETGDNPHKLVLAGKPGFGFEEIQNKIQDTRYNDQIVMTGFVSEEEKWALLKNADIFVFPTLYEGFGIPILEAQSVGCPVVAANNSSISEVADSSALLVDPLDPQQIAENIYKLLSDERVRNDIIQKGLENVKRFSWDKCAQKIAKILCKQEK